MCVRLQQGNFSHKTVYSSDPIKVAQGFEEASASYMHLVDLDGALDGTWTNKKTIQAIVDAIRIPIQTGGGIRSVRDIEERLSVGIDRVIIGTLAVKDPDFVKMAVKIFGADKIVVGIDAKEGKVGTDGWEEISHRDALDLALQMQDFGIQTIIYTDIAKDGMLQGPNINYTKKLIQETNLTVIASGGVSCIEDLECINEIGAGGVIVGKALYTNKFDLSYAIKRFEKR